MTESQPHDPVFAHLLEISREAVSKGNRHPAEILFRSCQTEAKLAARREAIQAKRISDLKAATRRAEDKARIVAGLLGRPMEIAPGPNDASPFATVKERRRPRDPLANLALEPDQIAAADEIMAIFEALTRGLQSTVRPLRAERVDGGARRREPFESMPPRLAKAHKERYLPWTERQKEAVASRSVGGLETERLTGVGLVIAVLIDRVPLRTIEGLYRTRNGVLTGRFREALDDYWPKDGASGRVR